MRRWLAASMVALVAAAVYAHTLGFDFVYDDVPVIVRNDRVHSLVAWREILGGPWWSSGLYRPFTSLTFAHNWTVGSGSPFLFHLINVLVHAAASVAVLLLAARLLPPAAALAAGLFFAVHPVHVEAVANVVGRAELLATLFTVAAVLLYWSHGDRPAPLLAVATLIAVLLGLASKESAFAAPALLLVADYAGATTTGDRPTDRFRGHWRLWAAVVGLAVGWLLLRASILGDVAGDYPAPGLGRTSIFERIVIMLPVVPEYLRLLFVPARLSADYSPDFLPVSPTLTARALLGAVLLVGAVALGVGTRQRAPAVSAGLLWIAGSLAIVANIVLPSGTVLAERLLYLASVGACLVAGGAWALLYARRPGPAVALLAVLVGVGALRSYTRALIWRSDGTLFPQLVRDAPGSFRADWVAGMLAYRAGDAVTGERLMRRGFSIYPGHAAMWIDFGRVLERRRQWREAGGAFWRAFTLEPALAAEAGRAVANYILAGELDTAAARLADAQRQAPSAPALRVSASHLALARGDAETALDLRRRLTEEHPGDWRYWLLTAEAALRLRRCPDLSASVDRLRRLRPALPRAALLADSARAWGCGFIAPSP